MPSWNIVLTNESWESIKIIFFEEFEGTLFKEKPDKFDLFGGDLKSKMATTTEQSLTHRAQLRKCFKAINTFESKPVEYSLDCPLQNV